MYVAGIFSNAGGDAAADNLAKCDGTRWSAVAPTNATTSAINNQVASLALSQDGSTLYVGGAFTNVNGDGDINYFAILDIESGTWRFASTWFDFSQVRDIVVDRNDGTLYVGGTFSDKVVSVDIENHTVTPMGGGLGSNVLALEQGPDGKLYAGGQFINAGGDEDADRVAVWDGTSWAAINSTYAEDAGMSSDYVTAYAWDSDSLYIGGLVNFVAKYSSAKSEWTQLEGLGGETRSLAISPNGELFAAGNSSYTGGEYFARHVDGVWSNLSAFSLASGTIGATADTSSSWGDWAGAWNVDFSPTGDFWYGGDFTVINGDTSKAYLAHWGLPVTFGGYSLTENAPSGYDGPVVTSVSKRSPAKGTSVVLYGMKLASVTKVVVNGVELELISAAEGQVTVVFPVQMPVGLFDVDLYSSYGKLTLPDAFVFEDLVSVNDTPFEVWTTINFAKDTVRVYAKNIVGLGKIQFFVDGEEIAWVRAVDATDPKLHKVGAASDLVRTVKLHEGKNRFEIKIGGTRAWRTTYVPEG